MIGLNIEFLVNPFDNCLLNLSKLSCIYVNEVGHKLMDYFNEFFPIRNARKFVYGVARTQVVKIQEMYFYA